MPAGLIHYKQRFAVVILLREFLKVYVHHIGVDPWEEQRKMVSVKGIDCAVDIEVFVSRQQRRHRPDPVLGPAFACAGLKSESTFVEEEDCVLSLLQEDSCFAAQFFLNSSCAAVLALA